jgi:hypothetical protein
MDLVGRLSNPDLTTFFQSLTVHEQRQEGLPQLLAPGVAPDGRRKFGTVRDAIIRVLTEAGSELRVRDIHTGVQKVLGEQVSASSVKDYLHKDRRRESPLFEYCGKSGYRLMR